MVSLQMEFHKKGCSAPERDPVIRALASAAQVDAVGEHGQGGGAEFEFAVCGL